MEKLTGFMTTLVGNNQWKETDGVMNEPDEHEIDPYN
jgi:hypothetical protein